MATETQDNQHGRTNHGTYKKAVHLFDDDVRRFDTIRAAMKRDAQYVDRITDAHVFRYALRFTAQHLGVKCVDAD